MKRTNWKAPVTVGLAFIIGLIVNMVSRQYLPGILPAGLDQASGLIAVLLQVAVSVLIVLIVVKIFHGEDE